MIDDHDGDDFWIASLFADGYTAFLLLILACVFWYIASQNARECAEKTCSDGGVPQLVDHQCMCVTEAK